jgi:hypothetical protein
MTPPVQLVPSRATIKPNALSLNAIPTMPIHCAPPPPNLLDQWLGFYWGAIIGDVVAVGWCDRPSRPDQPWLYSPPCRHATPPPAWGQTSITLTRQLAADPTRQPSLGEMRSPAQRLCYALPWLLVWHDDPSWVGRYVPATFDDQGNDPYVLTPLAQTLPHLLSRQCTPNLAPLLSTRPEQAIAAAALHPLHSPPVALLRSLIALDDQGMTDLDTYRHVGLIVGMVMGAYHGRRGWPLAWQTALADPAGLLPTLWGISHLDEVTPWVQALATAWAGGLPAAAPLEESTAIAIAQALQPR